MKLDTHVHTIREAEKTPTMTIDEQLAMAHAVGLDGFILTEHNAVWSDEQLASIRNNPYGLTIFKGVEVSCTDDFHYLVFGPLDFWPLPEEISPHDLIKIAHSGSNFVALAHPYRSPDKVLPPHIDDLDLDGVEVKSFNLQSPQAQKKSIELAERLHCAATAGTDHHQHCPRIGRIGIILDYAVNNEEELVQALKSRKFRRFEHVDF